jgi:hypothetical protein
MIEKIKTNQPNGKKYKNQENISVFLNEKKAPSNQGA